MTAITCCTDNYNIQKTLQEKLPKVTVLFTPTIGDFEDACMEQTNGLGFDLVLDFSLSHVPTGSQKLSQVSRKREILSVLSIMGIWACAASSF